MTQRDPAYSPELAWSLDALVAEAVITRLRADPTLAAFFGEGLGIVPIESDVLFDSTVLSLRAPALLVTLAGYDERRVGNAQYAELETLIDLYLVTAPETALSSQDWLRARVIHRIKLLLQEEQGTLRDGDGTRITEALTRFQRTLLSGRLRGTNLVVTQLRVLYVSDLDQSTREFAD